MCGGREKMNEQDLGVEVVQRSELASLAHSLLY